MQGIWFVFLISLLQISRLTAEKCDLRYFDHYPHKGCKPVLGEDGCPVRFNCTSLTEDQRQQCYYDGKWYGNRETIPNDCDECVCRNNPLHGAELDCPATDCPDWESEKEGCYMGYIKPSDCCPEEICPSGKNDPTCTYDGKTYQLGRLIQIPDEPCLTCTCTEGWRGKEDCVRANCLMGINARQIRKGCLPIYGEKFCCSVEMYCGEIKGSTPLPSPVEDTKDLCHYRGNYYKKGSIVQPTSNDRVQCECAVPPDFTCLLKKY